MGFYDYDLITRLKSYRFIVYLRRSSKDNEDKQIRSIKGQREDLQEIIKQYGLNVVVLLEESRSAFSVGRPEYAKMVEMINKGEANAVLTWHPNRLARNYADAGTFVQLMSDKKLKVLLTPHQHFEDNPRDKEYLMTECTRATRDSDDKSEAVKRGYRTKLKAGFMPSGRLPEGYIHAKNDKSEMINIPDPDRFALLKKGINLVLKQTHTPREALNTLNNEWGYRTRKAGHHGGGPLSKSGWYHILSNPIYCGDLSKYHDSDPDIHGQYEHLLTREEFEFIQVILGTKDNRRYTKHDREFNGLIKCGHCGSSIVTDEKWQIICSQCKYKFHKAKDRDSCPKCGLKIDEMKQPKILHYHYLACGQSKNKSPHRCPQKTFSIKDFQTRVDQLLEQFEIPKEFAEYAISVLREQHRLQFEERTVIDHSLESAINDTKKQLDNLLDMKLKGLINDEEYSTKKTSLISNKSNLKEKLESTDKMHDKWLELSEKTFNFATYAREWFAQGSPEQRRAIVRTLGSNLTLKDKELLIHQEKPYLVLKKVHNEMAVIVEKFEPNKKVDVSMEGNTLSVHFPSWLPG